MPTWILRKTVDGERVGAPRPCAINEGLGHHVGALTVEEHTALLLSQNEKAAEVVDGRRKIYRGDKLVGYIILLSTD